MDRWQIVIIAVIIGVVWWFAKRYFGQKKQSGETQTVYMNVNTWFHKAQEMMSIMDADIKEQHTEAWGKLSDEEKLRSTEEFMKETFGPDEPQKYTLQEKLQMGKANYILRGR